MDYDVLPARREAEVAVIRRGSPAPAPSPGRHGQRSRGTSTRARSRRGRGNTWNPKILAQMISHPRNGGYITRGQHWQRDHRHRCRPRPGTHPRRRNLRGESRRSLAKNAPEQARPPAEGHLRLSGLARCGKCDRVLNGGANLQRRRRPPLHPALPPPDAGPASPPKPSTTPSAPSCCMEGSQPAARAEVADAERGTPRPGPGGTAGSAARRRAEWFSTTSKRSWPRCPCGRASRAKKVRPAEYLALRDLQLDLIAKQEAVRDDLEEKLAALAPAPPRPCVLPPAFTAEEWDNPDHRQAARGGGEVPRRSRCFPGSPTARATVSTRAASSSGKPPARGRLPHTASAVSRNTTYHPVSGRACLAGRVACGARHRPAARPGMRRGSRGVGHAARARSRDGHHATRRSCTTSPHATQVTWSPSRVMQVTRS